MEVHPNVQDWHPVVLSTPSREGNKKRKPMSQADLPFRPSGFGRSPDARSGSLRSSAPDQATARAHRAEAETENFAIKTVSKTAASEIRELRTKKGWTQKQLAQAINERPDVVKAWENGTAIPNGQLLVKMRRALKLK